MQISPVGIMLPVISKSPATVILSLATVKAPADGYCMP